MTNETQALAARVEAAEGPSRELDAEICAHILRSASDQFGLGCTFEVQQSSTDETSWSVVTYANVQKSDRQSPPAYTSSLDAAMTLVPEGRSATISIRKPAAACIDGPRQNWCYANTPALALCAAALRARGDG